MIERYAKERQLAKQVYRPDAKTGTEKNQQNSGACPCGDRLCLNCRHWFDLVDSDALKTVGVRFHKVADW